MTKLVRDKLYLPVLRSRDAEMRGLENLSSVELDRILPAIEFTKSRRTKLNTDGSVAKCVERVHKIMDGRAYVADLTSMPSLQNTQIEDLLDPDNAFSKWCGFVEESLSDACIPVAHITDPFDESEFCRQASRLLKKSGLIAVRVPSDYADADLLLSALGKCVRSMSQVLLIVDAGFLVAGGVSKAAAEAAELVVKFGSKTALSAVVSSGFPSSVVLPGYGGDEYGKFLLPEVALSSAVKGARGCGHLVHGDYALIHPNDFEGVVTNWVPRVDVPLADALYYYRYRRDDGGYPKAARGALGDKSYVKIDCWAHQNIVAAANDEPLGRSPAHWIAVRVNFHISRQVVRLKD